MIFGIVLGFLLGQSRSRMDYEEQLRTVEEARATLESQLAQLRGGQAPKSQAAGQPPIPSPSGGSMD
jgi:type II secretory pathway pseudopilin PulG